MLTELYKENSESDKESADGEATYNANESNNRKYLDFVFSILF